jgi:hypothetical protein
VPPAETPQQKTDSAYYRSRTPKNPSFVQNRWVEAHLQSCLGESQLLTEVGASTSFIRSSGGRLGEARAWYKVDFPYHSQVIKLLSRERKVASVLVLTDLFSY